MQSALLWFCTFCTIVFFAGCSTKVPKSTYTTLKIPKHLGQNQPRRAPGSLYSGYDNLFSDAKAVNVGDILTIKVFENLRGSGSTDTKTTRSHTMDLSFPSPVIKGRKVVKNGPIFGFNQQASNGFKGKGGTNRSARLIATITARVIKRYPNGNLFIKGEKIIRINDDTQILRISGIVDPLYINPDNSVDSSRIANMYVEYNGKGFMAQTQRPGWLSNLLMKIWPF